MKLISSVGMLSIVSELASIYQIENRVTINVSYGSSAMILERMESGENTDLVIIASPAIETLLKRGVLIPESCVSLASTGIGLACKAGTNHPDISTVESFRHALVRAKSIAYTTAGVSGIYFAKLLCKLDLLDEVRAKSVTLPEGQIAGLLVNGSADLAVQLTSELVGFPGVDYIGPLPQELQLEMIFRAGIILGSTHSEVALDFLQFMSQSKLGSIYSKNGMKQVFNKVLLNQKVCK